MSSHSFTFELSKEQQRLLSDLIQTGNYREEFVPHTLLAASKEDLRINLYKSGKCVIQGKGARDWVAFTLEPSVLLQAGLDYEEVLNPGSVSPHMGIDESGKGDFFGPLVIAGVFVDRNIAAALKALDVRDSKRVTSDKKILAMAGDIRKTLAGKFNVVPIGPRAYNRLYASMRNVNQMLAWGHARVIENLLEKVPDCPRAISDQFGPTRQIEQALMRKGRKIKLEQMPRAESDIAVAAASILARAEFVTALKKMEERYGSAFSKGASSRVREEGEQLVRANGPDILLETAKCHFKTADVVLEAVGRRREEMHPDGLAQSKTVEPASFRRKKPTSS